MDRINTIERMPIEILDIIFSYLPASSLIICRQVCSRWMPLVEKMMIPNFRLRLTDQHSAHRLATDVKSRWLFHLQHRLFVCTGRNWLKTPAWQQWYSLPCTDVLSVNIHCCCRTIGGWNQPRVCILNRDWTAYLELKQFNLVVYPAPAGPIMSDLVDQVNENALEAWTNGGHTFYNWPLRGQHTADVPVPENQETFPLLTLPHVEKCTLAMNTANPDNALPAWEEYNLNFGMLFNKRILVPRIVELKSFTGWFWVAHSQLILNFERHILRALANIYPIKPHTRHITLYFTPSYPSWPTSCTHTQKSPLVCGLSSNTCWQCYHSTATEREQHLQLVARARLQYDTILVLRAATRDNLSKALRVLD